MTTSITDAALGAALRHIAQRLGYIAERGPHAGGGSVQGLLAAIARGEAVVIRLMPEERAPLCFFLLEKGMGSPLEKQIGVLVAALTPL